MRREKKGMTGKWFLSSYTEQISEWEVKRSEEVNVYSLRHFRVESEREKNDNVSFSLPDVFVDRWLYARYQASKAVKNAPINKIVKA